MCILKPLSTNDFRKKNDPPLPTNDKYYQRDKDVLKYLFATMPYNTKAEEVFIKVVIIDFIYSTQLKQLIGGAGVHELVDLILSLNFDARVKKGDPALVTDIANNNGGVNLFSFASKYCALHSIYVHKKDDYSIYDSAVARLFPKYTAEYHKNDPRITQITATQVECWRQNRDYKSFNDAIGTFLDSIGIDENTYSWRRSDFDRIVWEQRNN
ncbi:MAG: hypothetical protein J6D09_01885 [Clostridia bacterium]|nr:hypothetical protein [Clostridia bacterium]